MSDYEKYFKSAKAKNKKNFSARRPTRKTLRKKRKKFPLLSFILGIFILTATTVLIFKLDDVGSVLSRFSLSTFTKSIAQEGNVVKPKEKNDSDESMNPEKTSPSPNGELTQRSKASVRRNTSYYQLLEEKEKKIEQREEALKKLEENLQRQEKELEAKLIQLNQLRSDISLALQDRVKTNKEKMTKLVEIYSNMKPKKAAAVFENMEDELATCLLYTSDAADE